MSARPVVIGTGAATSTDPAAAAAGSPTGQLRVSVDRGVAFVLVDGVVRGRTPYAAALAPGEHRVTVRAVSRSFQRADTLVAITAGDTATVAFVSTDSSARRPR